VIRRGKRRGGEAGEVRIEDYDGCAEANIGQNGEEVRKGPYWGREREKEKVEGRNGQNR
jgi:hypothetical protein